MILPLGGRGLGFDSRKSPFSFGWLKSHNVFWTDEIVEAPRPCRNIKPIWTHFFCLDELSVFAFSLKFAHLITHGVGVHVTFIKLEPCTQIPQSSAELFLADTEEHYPRTMTDQIHLISLSSNELLLAAAQGGNVMILDVASLAQVQIVVT